MVLLIRRFLFFLRRVGQRGRRSRRLSGGARRRRRRRWRSGLGSQRSGETGRREPERDEQEAAEHVGGAADQEHAPAEGKRRVTAVTAAAQASSSRFLSLSAGSGGFVPGISPSQ